MSEKNLKITVLMPVYNDSRYLRQSVCSILNQSFGDFEFLIIDDGSTDGSDEIIRSFRDSRIVHKKIRHSGLAAALNSGMRNASGDWIARIDADDLSTLRRLKVQHDHLKKNPGTDVLGSWSVYFSDPDRILFQINPPADDVKIREFLELHNPINHSSVIFRKESVLKEGGYDEKFGVYEDFELWLRVKNKLSFNIIPESLVYTRQRKDSLTSLGSKNKIYNLLMKNIKDKYQLGDNPVPDESTAAKLFWIEYFYGDKSRSRKFYRPGSGLRKTIAFYNSYLPEYFFNRVKDLRLKQRIESFKLNRKQYKKELNHLLNLN
ncbi:MAG: glycosyltransferase [Bacteroidetes bacterium]|nr:glycosyltransferase [Bacteroidota bacterium]